MKPQTTIQKTKTIFALKQKVVFSLNKLSDRDTYQLGSIELEKIAQSLSIETIPPFLSCISDTDSDAKSLVRKECVRLMGILGISHGSRLAPQMPKIISSIVKRLKDSDSIVRDACVDTCGVLAKNVNNEGIFVILARPLFETLGEQNKYVQFGGALCLSRVIDEIEMVPNGVLPQMLVRVVKLLKNPHFMAKPAVIELIRSIIQAGGVSIESALSSALTTILDALKNRDWNTRKSASIALSNLAISSNYMLSPFKNTCLHSLESSRFDKVKPVRDSVIHAIKCWKSVPGDNSLEVSEAGSSTKENFYNDYSEVASTSETGSRSSSFRNQITNLDSNSNPNSNSSLYQNRGKNLANNKSTTKRTPLSLKKHNNPIIPNNNPKQKSEWQIEVSVPPKKTNLPLREIKETEMEIDMEIEEELSEIRSRSCVTKDITIEGDCNSTNLNSNLNLNLNMNSNLSSGEEDEVEMEVESRLDSNLTLNLNESRLDSNLNLNGSGVQNELVLIRKQLEGIESKQANLYQLVQEFMGSSMDNLATLNSKVFNMENALDHFIHNFANSELKNYANISPRVSSSSLKSPINTTYKNQSFLPSKNGKILSENEPVNRSPKLDPKQINTDAFIKRVNGFGSTSNELPSNNEKLYTFCTGGPSSSNMSAQSNSKRVNGFDWSVESTLSNNNNEQVSNKIESFSKRVNGFSNVIPSKESPFYNGRSSSICTSAQSNSKRVNGFDWSVETTLTNNSNEQGSGKIESFSKPVNGYLSEGDIESAYVLVINNGDDSSVIRLMGQTGPVLDDLSSETASAVLKIVSMHLMDRKFLEFALPWIQQVVGLSTAQDMRQLFLSPRAQRELLYSLQQVVNKGNLDPSIKLIVSQLAFKLGKAFGPVQLRKVPMRGAKVNENFILNGV